MTVHSSQGIAADGVAKVALVDADGQVVAETSVRDNIYSFDRVPAGNAAKVVAYGATGEVVFSMPEPGPSGYASLVAGKARTALASVRECPPTEAARRATAVIL